MQTVTVVVCIDCEQSLFCREERKKTGRARYTWDESGAGRLLAARAFVDLLIFMAFFPADFGAKERLLAFYGLHGLAARLFYRLWLETDLPFFVLAATGSHEV